MKRTYEIDGTLEDHESLLDFLLYDLPSVRVKRIREPASPIPNPSEEQPLPPPDAPAK